MKCLLSAFALASVLCLAGTASGQFMDFLNGDFGNGGFGNGGLGNGFGNGFGMYSPQDIISQRILAQSALIRANSEAAVSFGVARNLNAEAVRKEIDNSVEFVKAYWERRRIWEEQTLQRRGTHLSRQKKRNQKAWERLQYHPEMTGSSLVEGKPMNFVLQRLSGTMLSYQGSTPDPDLVDKMQLTDELLSSLNLRKPSKGGEHLVFRANEGTALNVDWWPYVLRSEKLDAERNAFEQARQAAIKEASADSRISEASLERLDASLASLAAAFLIQHPQSNWARQGTNHHHRCKEAETFLLSLDKEIRRLQTTGDAGALSGSHAYDPAKHGQDLVALLTYMARHGLEFAPATPGREESYHTVFAMMRDLYEGVAESDPGIKVEENGGGDGGLFR